ncbi:hypothetical protein KW805_02340 [Candidatus Pacearchaeota archaeon]|nr:hypothetical protein [Candidatus Pacearchaeota archaeon]
MNDKKPIPVKVSLSLYSNIKHVLENPKTLEERQDAILKYAGSMVTLHDAHSQFKVGVVDILDAGSKNADHQYVLYTLAGSRAEPCYPYYKDLTMLATWTPSSPGEKAQPIEVLFEECPGFVVRSRRHP